MSSRPPRTAVSTTPPVVNTYGKFKFRAAVGVFFSDNTAEVHCTDCTDFYEAKAIATALHDTLRRRYNLPYRPPPTRSPR